MRIPSTLLIAICTIITSIGNVFAAQVDPILAHAMPIVRTADGDTVPCFSIKIQPVILNGQTGPYCPTYGNLTLAAVDSATGNRIPGLTYSWSGLSVNTLSDSALTWLIIVPEWCDTVYYPTVTVSDGHGCVKTVTDTVEVRSSGPQFIGNLPDIDVSPQSGGGYMIPDFKSLISNTIVTSICYPFYAIKYSDAYGTVERADWYSQEPAAGAVFTEDSVAVVITITDPCGVSNSTTVNVLRSDANPDTSVVIDGISCPAAPMVTDHEGNIYATVQIGNQCWMRDNLRTTTSPSTGTYLIPAANVGDTYTGKQARWYNNDSATYAPMNYGLLYNWNAAVDTFNTEFGETSVNSTGSNAVSVSFTGHRRGICPAGWHLPSDTEWNTMEATVSGSDWWWTIYETFSGGRGSHAGKLAGGDDWTTSSTSGAPGDYSNAERNVSGFSALPAGECYGTFIGSAGVIAIFWSSSQLESDSSNAWSRFLLYYNEPVIRSNKYKYYGCSVRCLRDEVNTSSLPTVTTGPVTSVTSTSATCGGEVTSDGGATVTARGVCWSTSPNPTVADSHTSDGNGMGSFNSYISGLIPNTTYYVRAYATSSVGTAYGEQVSFTTPVNPNGDGYSCSGTPTVTDIDGNVYNTVQIGAQCWIRENLRTTKYADGTSISQGSGNSYTVGYWSYPNSDSTNKHTYGLLYNWKAVMGAASSSDATPSGAQGICPTGWHVPSDAEWTILTDYVGNQSDYLCGNNRANIAKALASPIGWNAYTNSCSVGYDPITNNATGFGAIPAGYGNGSYHYDFSGGAYFWSTTEYNPNNAYYRHIFFSGNVVSRSYSSKYQRYSVRCLRDEGDSSLLPAVTTDSVSNITAVSALCGGEVTSNDGAEVTARGVCWSISRNPTTNDSHTTDGSGNGSFSSSITNLLSNLTYYVRAYATNQYGTVYGEEISFTTPVNSNGDSYSCSGVPTVTDIDSNVYNTVQIGAQCWMRDNLRTTKYANDSNVYYNYPNGDTSNKQSYGLLYNWSAVMRGASSSDTTPSGVQGVCPTGWHVPNSSEWTLLTDYVSSRSDFVCGNDSTRIAKALASTIGWNRSAGYCVVGNNLSTNNATGFGAIPAGYSSNYDNYFSSFACFWSSTEQSENNAFSRRLSYQDSKMSLDNSSKNNSYSVRCLRDNSSMSINTKQVTSITTNSADCGGFVVSNVGLEITTRGVCWSTLQNPTIESDHTTDGSGIGLFSSNITGLTPNTTYYLRAYATSIEGTVYGEELTFTTLCPVISINGRTSIYSFESSTLTASGADDYIWSTGDSLATITVNPIATTTYSVTGTDSYGCVGSASTVVSVRAIPTLNPAEVGTGLNNIELDCNKLSTTLCANVVSTAEDYIVESIPYDPPFEFTEGFKLNYNTDDSWFSIWNLPFTFRYYGYLYNQIVPGSNSVATFNTDKAGQYCDYLIRDTIPSRNLFANTIFACYRDINLNYLGTGGGAYEGVFGEAPHRRYKLSFNNVGLFGNQHGGHMPSDDIFSSMIVLYEGSNIIDIYLRDAPNNSITNNGNGVLGLQNSTGTKGITPPGRNTGPWTAHEEAWRFIPVADSNYTVTWYLGTDTTLATGIIVGTGDTITVSPQESTDYTARLQYINDYGDKFILFQTCHVTVNRGGPIVTVNASQNELCEGDNTTLTATGADTYLWSTGDEGSSITVYPTTTTTYYVTGYSGAECSSIDSITVTVWESVDSVITVTACDSYTWNDTIYYISGEYVQHFQTIHGCDSIVTMNLTINQPDWGVWDEVACDSFTWIDGVTYYESTSTPTVILTNAAGCDSVVTLNLTIIHSTSSDTSAVACGSFTWKGETHSASGDYTFYEINSAGCDSVVTLHLTINPTPEVSIIGDTIICPNGAIMLTATGADNYLWSNGSTNSFIPVNQFGIYRVTGTSAAGCADTATITVLVAQPPVITISGITDLCAGDTSIITVHGGTSYLWNNGSTDSVMTVSDAGAWQVIGYDENGCNSMTSVNVNVWQPTVSEFSVFCPDSCYIWNYQTYCESGDYTQTLQTTYGCDSIVTLHLTITVGINDHDGFDFKVYPNPTSNIVNVECIMKNEDWGEMELHLCDAYGRLLDVVGANNHSPLRTAQIDLYQYAKGVYFVKAVVDGKNIAVRKVVKQ